MKHLIINLAYSILLSCSTQNQENRQKVVDTATAPSNKQPEPGEETTLAVESQTTDSSFNSFLTEFSTNSEFQLTRIEFPFKIKLLDILDNEEIITIPKNKWKHTNLLDTAGIETKEYDAYSQTTHIADSVATIKLRGIDNGIRVDFTFEFRDGRWYLTKKFDASS